MALLAEPVTANLATVDADGTPHVTPVWVDVAGGDVVVNTAEGRRKVRRRRGLPDAPARRATPQGHHPA
ncbi:MAG: pyridoxamine 5'-phosphate oxidase family protein [Acidimicrobiales bacterium]|nr:pyridoxamine 5'-phosphate oxidase family protein [Acidimicrobiales bacterium]